MSAHPYTPSSAAPAAASEAQLHSIFSAMSEGLVIQAADGRVIDANPAASRILGLSRDELLGRTSVDPRWHAIRADGSPYPGEEHPGMVTLRTGRPCHDQLMGVHDPRRGLRWLSINANPVWGDGGEQPSGVVATFVDITERRALEARLAATTAELQDLYDNAPAAYHSLDAEGKFLRANATALCWMGRSADEIVGRHTPGDFLDARGREQFERLFQLLKSGGDVDGAETDLQTADGVRRRLRLSSTAVTDEQGRFVRSRSMALDISELHAAREALRLAHREQAAMLDHGLLGIVKVQRRRFIWANPGVARIFGYAPDELLGQDSRPLYADEASYLQAGSALQALTEEGQSFRIQLEMRRKDGDEVWIDMNVALLSRDEGILLGVFVDITPIKRAEAKRLKIIELEAENRSMRETAQQKQAFLAHMSHELRTPLNAVLGFAGLLQGAKAPDPAKRERYLQLIVDSGRYLDQLIGGVLDYAALESAQLPLQRQRLLPAQLVREVLDMMEAEIGARQLVVAARVDQDLCAVQGDAMRIKQVLSQLLGNAIRFTPAGGRIEVRALAAGGGGLRVEVEDTGIGIAEADLPRLFTAFEQLSSGLSKTHDGLGLGLALSRKLVEAHGGTLGVRSRPGQGSVFHFELPCATPRPA